jgi:hypothetical protein
MRCVGHVAYVGKMINSFRILVADPEDKRPHKDLGIGGRIIWILKI